MHPIVR